MLQYAVPPGYQRQQPIKRPKLGPWLGVIDAILDDDKQRPVKQRHTAHRIWMRLRKEHPNHPVGEATQQALLEAHEHAFAYFGGVFKTRATTT
jgi:transposase